MENEFKQQNCGIYKIENLINGKIYIGQSVNIQKRWSSHKARAKDINCTAHLYLAMRKYGIENFAFKVIEYCKVEELNDREIYWIQFYDSTNREKGYNIRYGGESGGNYYDYHEIYQLWLKGMSCIEIEKKLHCNDSSITAALRMYGVTEYEARSRAVSYKRQIVMKDVETNLALKIFNGVKSVARFFELSESAADNLPTAIKYGYSYCGFKWEDLNESNHPLREYTKEEILSYKAKPKWTYTEEEKLNMSLNQRTVTRPLREELKQLIRTKPFTEIGKMYGVSDNAIRKWCDFENLPRKKQEINSYSDEEWKLI